MPAAKQPTLNPQITDAITQTDVIVVGDAPAVEMGNLYQTVGHSWALATGNAVFAQQQADVNYQASSSIAVAKLLGLPV